MELETIRKGYTDLKSDLKILIVSNNCLSKHNSNGRTMLNMLGEFAAEDIVQIYTSSERIEKELCHKSLALSNSIAIKSLFGRGLYISDDEPVNDDQATDSNSDDISGRKNALTMLLRDLVWDHNFRLQKAVVKWAGQQKPGAVALQLGDSTHIITIAMSIAKALDIPLVTYNTEDYFFKKYDYMKKSLKAGLLYRLFHKRFCKRFERMMAKASACIYNCEGLKNLYKTLFPQKAEVIYCPTELSAVECLNPNGKIVYGGNLGVGRHTQLIKVAKALQKIDSQLHLDIYGKATQDVIDDFANCPGISYHSFIEYNDLCHILADSRLLVHVESFDEYYSVDTRYAFSTKIADYCAIGVPMFMFAPDGCESTQYAKDYQLAFLCDSEDELESTLRDALFKDQNRKLISNNAVNTAKKNHDIQKNNKQFYRIICDACGM